MDEKKASEKNDLISMIGDRLIWLDFTHKIRKDKKKIWDIVLPMIEDYMKEGKK